jgi:hypothetical protein
MVGCWSSPLGHHSSTFKPRTAFAISSVSANVMSFGFAVRMTIASAVSLFPLRAGVFLLIYQRLSNHAQTIGLEAEVAQWPDRLNAK